MPSLVMGEQFHKWLLRVQTIQWPISRGWWQLCPLRCEGQVAPGAGCRLASKDVAAWEAGCRPAGGPEGPQGGNSLAGRADAGVWPLVAGLLSRPVFLFKYHPHQRPSSHKT